MELVVLGHNHLTTSLAERERWNVAVPLVVSFLKEVNSLSSMEGAVYLSTCNRVELYGVATKTQEATPLLEVWKRFLKEKSPLEPAYCYRQTEAFSHLLRVVSGLDSMVLGENEVLGQVKRAYAQSLELGTTGPLLNFTFQQAMRLAKKVRSQTGIARYPTSVSTVAMMLLDQVFGDFGSLQGLVIGLGEMGRQTAKMAKERGVSKLFVMNRTEAKAHLFAKEVPSEVVSMEVLSEVLQKADFVVTSTSSETPLISEASFLSGKTRSKPIVMIDLGVPRDIEAELGKRQEVYLYNIDDLKTIADRNRQFREKEAALAEEMIGDSVKTFWQEWEKRRSLQSDPLFYKEATVS